jgi:hypothetical protein
MLPDRSAAEAPPRASHDVLTLDDLEPTAERAGALVARLDRGPW